MYEDWPACAMSIRGGKGAGLNCTVVATLLQALTIQVAQLLQRARAMLCVRQ